MLKVPVYNLNGEKTKDIEISSRIFDRVVRPDVVHQVVVAQQANARFVLADTKDKGEVSGGGKKPWRQKGTGRARHGSSRSPLWVGGGVTFGPTKDRNFTKQVNKKQKQLALAMCLSDRVVEKKLVVIDEIKLESGKTNYLRNLVINIKNKISDLKESKKVLIVLDKKDAKIVRAAVNLDDIKIILADSLNCIDILKYNSLLVSEKSIKVIDKHYKKINEAIK